MARIVGSLDHISDGRAGWNIVTGRHPLAAFNFGHSEGVAHAERYERGREFTEVVLGLWTATKMAHFVATQSPVIMSIQRRCTS